MLDILYQDATLVAINKPTGLLVHRSAIDRHETRFALQLLRDQIGQRVYPVHRLDKPTSGVLVFALDRETAAQLAAAFTTGEVHKLYIAVVRGYTAEEGTIDYPLRVEPDRMTDRDARQDKGPQTALTDYRRLAGVELPVRVDRYPSSRYSLIETAPRTGRKHQIRRHMKHIAHPIVGDTTYGKSRHNRLFLERFGSTRLLLHARSLAFHHPATVQALTITAPLDEAFGNVLKQLGWYEMIGRGSTPHQPLPGAQTPPATHPPWSAPRQPG